MNASELRGTKFKAMGEVASRRFQRYALDAGAMWEDGSVEEKYLGTPYFFVSRDLTLTSSTSGEFFVKSYNKEISLPCKEEGHPHAMHMAQYAEDAKTTDKPWENWEIKTVQGTWKEIGFQFIFDAKHFYRLKPSKKLVNGVEIPDLLFTPEECIRYYYVDISCEDLYGFDVFHVDFEDQEHRLKLGICYPCTEEGKQTAILHAKALLGIGE